MTRNATKMGVPPKKVNKTKMKQTKKKKLNPKQLEDSISETISFVIKGKLTPIKPAAVKKPKFKKTKKPKTVNIDKVIEIEPSKIQSALQKDAPTTAKKKEENKVAKSKKDKQPKKKATVKVSRNANKKIPKPPKAKPIKETDPVTNKTMTLKRLKSPVKTNEEKVKKVKKVVKAIKRDTKTSKKPVKSKTTSKRIKQEENNKVTNKEECNINNDDSTTSDEITLDLLCQKNSKLDIVKTEPDENDIKTKCAAKVTKVKPKVVSMNKRSGKDNVHSSEQKKKLKLFSLWTGPKRHRVASLNAKAKVHCLYENETRGSFLDHLHPIKKEPIDKKPVKMEKEEILPTRTLRMVPGLRGIGKHWDMHDSTSSSEDTGSDSGTEAPIVKPKKEPVKKSETKSAPKRRKKNELVMDLKDMVVQKRMASLNASAILAASYSLEKNASKSPKTTSDSDSDETYSDDSDRRKYIDEDYKKDDKLIEVRATPNKKVAVIVNQDTDVTITGVYVNSTTRSTHHEGYCSIAGMQYRISATSHTQTAATAVATETLLQSASSSSQENSNGESTPSKSYTPLDALSNMQPPSGPPGTQHGVPLPHHHLGPPHISPQLSPLPRRHGCTSAFTAPPGHYPQTHHHPPPPPPPPPLPLHNEQGYMHGYYQPAGPLISVTHAHAQQPLGKPAPLSETSPSVSPPPSSHQPPAPSSAGDSSDNDVIITSVTTAKDASPPQHQQHQHHQQASQTYRLNQYPPAHATGYSYGYPTHYYQAPPVPPPPPAPTYAHHDLCYSPNPYLHHKYTPPTTYRRYLGPPPGAQYFQAPDLYGPQPPPPTASAASQQNQQVVTATPAATASASGYQPSPSGPQPPPTLLETYQPPPTLVETYHPPPHYYSGYAPAPPTCYTHSPQPRGYINAPYPCPCPMQSCPKNVHTGPLIGDNKRSSISSITKDSAVYLPPVALALPLEPASATGPPSPARGSAGMPPPPSPAGATYQAPPTPKRETPEPLDLKLTEKRRKARVGKSVVRNNLHQNNMLLMCKEPVQNTYIDAVKREVESPKEEPKKDVLRIEDNSKMQTTNIVDVETKEKKVDENTQPMEQIPSLKTEEKEEAKHPDVIENPVKETCVKTVAENVKVKNMKRKTSAPKSEDTPPLKKQRLEKLANGSYKDLIKKSFTSVHINNGKRKLLSNRTLGHRLPKIRLKKPTTKRKIILSKEDLKKIKNSKPLTASNLHNSKQNLNKDKSFVDLNLIENKEPQKKLVKKTQVNSKCVANGKKITAAILDDLVSKSTVDVTIESVVSEIKPRTIKNVGALRTNVEKCPKVAVKTDVKKDSTVIGKKSTTNVKSVTVKSKLSECRYKGIGKRKTKCKSVEVVPLAVSKIPRRSLPLPRWSNGWTWKGEPFESKVFLNSDEATLVRKCYPAMRHEEGDTIEPGECVLLKAGPRKNDLPFVAKIASLWENPDDGEMMMSLLWYYRPEHTEQGRLPSDQPDEVFASRHKDSNSVACVEDKCFVLTFNEYCRYRKNLRRLEEGMEDTGPCIPATEPYPRTNRQPPISIFTSPDMVFFCRRVYDFRQKRIVKNPS